jgi:tape measure domain-containing protein
MAKPIETLSIQLKFKDAGSQAVIEKLKGSLKRLELGASGAKPRIASLRKEILAQGNASVKSVANIQAQSTALKALRDEAKIGSRAFNQLTKDIAKLDGQMGKAQGRGGQRGMGARRATQAAGAVISGGIFGGPEGALGALGGLAVGGVEGAFAGAAIGAVVGGGRQALGETAAYAAQINKLKIALEGVAPNQDDFNFAVETAARATRELNVPQEQSIRGITRLTAAVTGAGGPVQDAATTFRNVTAAIKATGGSSEDVQGAITAMVQVFSKGKVSAEELSGQLGERLPGAVTLFAKANKMTLPELQKNLKAGTVGLNELMNFIRQLGDEFGGTAEKIAGSNEEAGARLNVAFNAMRLGVGQALMGTGSDLQNTFGNFIEEITPKVIAATEQLAKALKPVVKNLDLILVSITGLAAGAALGAVVKGFLALKASLIAAYTAGTLLTALPIFGGALAVAGIVTGIYAITKAFSDQRTEIERLAAASRNIPIAQLDNNQRLTQIADSKRVLSSLRAKRKRLVGAGESEGGFDTSDIDTQIAAEQKRLQRLTAPRKTKDGKFVYDPVTADGGGDGDKSLARRIEQAQRLEAQTEAQLRLSQAQGAIGRVLAQQANQRASLQARINKLVGDGTNATINEAAANAKSNLKTKQKLELQNRINRLYEQAKRPLEAIVQGIKDKVNGDKMYKRLIAEGVNPALAEELVNIDKAFKAGVRKLDVQIENLKSTKAEAELHGKIVEGIDDQIAALERKKKALEGDKVEADNAARATIKEPTFAEGLEEAVENQEDALKKLINPLNQGNHHWLNDCQASACKLLPKHC